MKAISILALALVAGVSASAQEIARERGGARPQVDS